VEICSTELWPYIKSVIDTVIFNGNVKKCIIETSSIVSKFNLFIYTLYSPQPCLKNSYSKKNYARYDHECTRTYVFM
jgi:hypothetical protein